MTSSISYFEAILIGAVQGVSELFPVSSLGHSVLVPALVGGRWAHDLSMTGDRSPYLAVLVAMHVATALALILYFWRDWVRLIGALVGSAARRRVRTADERVAWLLVLSTVPVGLAGLLLEHALRGALGRPVPAAVFLTLNGVALYGVERMRRRPAHSSDGIPAPRRPGGRTDPPASPASDPWATTDIIDPSNQDTVIIQVGGVASPEGHHEEQTADRRLSALTVREAVTIGSAQCLALLPGISRSGVTIGAGLLGGLRHDDAARFAFLLATPVILAAGLLKIPELFDPSQRPVLGPALAGSAVAGLCAYASVRFLTSYFETRTLKPFAVYCIVAGLGCLAYLTAIR